MRSQMNPDGAIALERSRVQDYLTLTKPELTFLSVITAVAGYVMGGGATLHFPQLVHTLFGTALVGGGAGALNQLMEREYDGLMKRTENRPLPSGRLNPREVMGFGVLLSLLGLTEIGIFTNLLACGLTALTLVTYLFLYTPLKRITPYSTIVGGIPGALPPLIGWAAARGEITGEAWILFGILFFWQMPHFFSLAWMYRKDYARAGYRLLTVLDPDGVRTARQIAAYTAGLLVVSLLFVATGVAGFVYATGAILLGAGFLALCIDLLRSRSSLAARRVFFASLAYLPALMLILILDRI